MQLHSVAGGSLLAWEDMVSSDLSASQGKALASPTETGSSVTVGGSIWHRHLERLQLHVNSEFL